jgi:hypothetical protein
MQPDVIHIGSHFIDSHHVSRHGLPMYRS